MRHTQKDLRKGTAFERLRLNAGSIHSFFIEDSLLSFLERNIATMRGRLLDVGCGDMRYKPIVLNSDITEYVGLDLEAGHYGHAFKPDVFWDGVTMPFSDNSFDSALLFETLEHCTYDQARGVLKEIARVLRPGGVLLFTIPFINPLHGLPYDYQRLTPEGMRVLMQVSDMHVTGMEPNGSHDASLATVLAIWIIHRPMPRLIRKVLRKLVVIPIRCLLWMDKRQPKVHAENSLSPGLFGCATPSTKSKTT